MSKPLIYFDKSTNIVDDKIVGKETPDAYIYLYDTEEWMLIGNDGTLSETTDPNVGVDTSDIISYIQSQVRKTCPKKTTSSLVTQDLFSISGGAVEIIRLIGHITTTTESIDNNTKIVFTATNGNPVDLCDVNNMNNKTAGKVCNITKVKADALTVSSDDGTVVITTATQLILTPGIISLDCVDSSTGVIDWQIEYSPITSSSIVEPL